MAEAVDALRPEGGVLEGDDLVKVSELAAAAAIAGLDGAHDLEELAVRDRTVLVVVDLLEREMEEGRGEGRFHFTDPSTRRLERIRVQEGVGCNEIIKKKR